MNKHEKELCDQQRREAEIYVYSYPLRPNHTVTIAVPADMTSDEAERLRAIVAAIAPIAPPDEPQDA